MSTERTGVEATVIDVYSDGIDDIVLVEDLRGNRLVGVIGYKGCRLPAKQTTTVNDAFVSANPHLLTPHEEHFIESKLGADRIILDLYNVSICKTCPLGGRASRDSRHCKIYNPDEKN